MKFGIVYPRPDPAGALEAAEAAEKAGWDAFFTWEAPWGMDPWVTLGAAAARTSKIRLGTMLTPLAIRQPWKLASETATLDALSGGRAVLSAGLGAVNTGFAEFSLPTDLKIRAERLDECMDILDGLWQAMPFAYEGKHYRISEQSFIAAPRPVQEREGRAHVPVWMVGAWNRPKSMLRVLRCDGILPNVFDEEGKHRRAMPADVREISAWLEAHSPAGRKIDIIVEGSTPGSDRAAQDELVGPYAAAGATWWVEAMWQVEKPAELLSRIRQGPPEHRS